MQNFNHKKICDKNNSGQYLWKKCDLLTLKLSYCIKKKERKKRTEQKKKEKEEKERKRRKRKEKVHSV